MLAIAYNLRRLTQFSGRQGRALFWPYVGVLWLLATASLMAATLPAFFAAFARTQRFANGDPDSMFPALAIIAVLFVLLAAASVARRLHDSGRSGAWGLLPCPFW